MNWFSGRELVVATKHEKEKVIAPVFEKNIGVKCVVPVNFDTDQFGTFSGETERIGSPIEVARNKCLHAMELTGCDLAISSEGSFGQHPYLFFSAANEEFMVLIDKKNNLEIAVRELYTDTNYSSMNLESEKELVEFAQKASFPSHALIMKKSMHDAEACVKGIQDQQVLINVFNAFISNYKHAFVETDMRACFNPTRMSNIEKTASKLLKKVLTTCPSCATPGFGITAVKSGLPCRACTLPTKSIQSHVYTCQSCNFSKEDKFPHGNIYEDPMYCDYCNP